MKEGLAIEVGGENFDPDLAYFKNITALGRGHSRELEIEIAKRIDEGRRMIARALRDFRVLLKKRGGKNRFAQSIFDALKSKVWVLGTAGSEKFHLIEKALLKVETILHERADSAELNYFAETEKRFHEGRMVFEKARNELVEKNLRFAVSIAKPYFRARTGLSFFDVIEEANTGLIKAAERYRHTMGFCFTTYAHWWIRQAITRAYANKSRGVRVPVHKYELRSKISRVQKNLNQRFAGASKPEEVAKQLGIKINDVLESDVIFQVSRSIDGRIPHTKDMRLKDCISDDKEKTPEALYVAIERVEFIKQIMEQVLTPREQFVIRRRLGFDDEPEQELRGLGRVMNLSGERVRQIQNEAMAKLRSPEILEKLRLAV